MLRLRSIANSWKAKMKEIALDYKSAAEGTLDAAQKRPVRTAIYISGTIFAWVSYKNIPSETSYIAHVVRSSNDLLLCGPERSKYTDDYLQTSLQLHAKGMMRYRNMGLFSVIYFADHNKETKSYKAVCKYSNPRWKDMTEFVLDIGFLGRWWKLNYVMTDYDVNFAEIPKEYKNVFDKYYDFLRTSFGYSYFSDLTAHQRKTKFYVETIVGESTIPIE